MTDTGSSTSTAGRTAVRVAAITYQEGEGGALARLLDDLVAELRDAGVCVAGAIQDDVPRDNRTHDDMLLRELSSRRTFRISEDRGPAAAGCHLDTFALEDAAGLVEASLDSGAEILLLNKFGKREAQGRGFRGALAAAVQRDIPVLVGIGARNLDAWKEFAGPLAEALPLEREAVAAWCRSALRRPCR